MKFLLKQYRKTKEKGKSSGRKKAWDRIPFLLLMICAVVFLAGCGRELEEREFPEILVIRETPLLEALEKEQKKNSKYLDYGQVQCAVFSEDLVMNPEARRDALTCLEQMPVFARNILVFAGSEEVLEKVEIQEEGLGARLEGFYKNVPKQDREEAVTLGELFYWLHNGDSEVVIPRLIMQEGEMVLSGGVELKAEVTAGNFARWRE